MTKLTEYNKKESTEDKALRFAKGSQALDQGYAMAKAAVAKMPNGPKKQKALEILSKYVIE